METAIDTMKKPRRHAGPLHRSRIHYTTLTAERKRIGVLATGKKRKKAKQEDPGRPPQEEACGCAECDGKRKWPRYYVGSDDRNRPGTWLAWECYLETQACFWAEDRPRTEKQAMDEHLTIRTKPNQRIPEIQTLRGECAVCGGLSRKGRLCLHCEAVLRRAKMTVEEYLAAIEE